MLEQAQRTLAITGQLTGTHDTSQDFEPQENDHGSFLGGSLEPMERKEQQLLSQGGPIYPILGGQIQERLC